MKFSAETVDSLISELNHDHPLKEVADSLYRTTVDVVSIRVDDDGDLIKISFLANGPYQAIGNGVNLDANSVRECFNGETWDVFREAITYQLTGEHTEEYWNSLVEEE